MSKANPENATAEVPTPDLGRVPQAVLSSTLDEVLTPFVIIPRTGVHLTSLTGGVMCNDHTLDFSDPKDCAGHGGLIKRGILPEFPPFFWEGEDEKWRFLIQTK